MFRKSNISVFLMALAVSLISVSASIAAPAVKVPSKGQKLFLDNCAACHQEDAIGQPGFAPSLVSPQFLSLASDKFLYETIAKGREGTAMVEWEEELGEKNIKEIIAYLRTFAKGPNISAKVNAQRVAMGDANLGKVWFRSICATCHGIYGQGYSADGSGTAIGGPSFLKVASDGYIRETIKRGRDGTRMRPFYKSDGLANLNDYEIDDIILYMRTLKGTPN